MQLITIAMYLTPTLVYVSENVIKIEKSLLANFDEIWPTTLYYSISTVY